MRRIALTDDTGETFTGRALVDEGRVEVVALTLGEQGTLLVTKDGTWSAEPLPEALTWAMAAGSAALSVWPFNPVGQFKAPQSARTMSP